MLCMAVNRVLRFSREAYAKKNRVQTDCARRACADQAARPARSEARGAGEVRSDISWALPQGKEARRATGPAKRGPRALHSKTKRTLTVQIVGLRTAVVVLAFWAGNYQLRDPDRK